MPRYRNRLENGEDLDIGGKKYHILDLISDQGGSCLVYKAERLSEIPSETKFVIKEFYPSLDEIPAHDIQRIDGELIVAKKSKNLFNEEKMKFSESIARQIAESYTNPDSPTLGCPDYASVNGTAYSILELGKGETLQKIEVSNLSPSEIIQIMLSLCSTIEGIHTWRRLYLDIKPSNIFLFENEYKAKRHITLFDFGTVFEIDNLPENGLYSRGWAPYEQEFWLADEITTSTDIYAIGGVFFWLLVNKKPDNELPTRILFNDFSFLENVEPKLNWFEAKEVFKRTLNREPHKRTKNIGRIIRIFEGIEKNLERW